MALTSVSTFDDAYAQLNDNLDWPGNFAKSRLWLEAARWMMVNRPSFAMRQNTQISWRNLEKEIERAHSYVLSDTTSQNNRSPFVKGVSRYGA